jgi:hypothetical protein
LAFFVPLAVLAGVDFLAAFAFPAALAPFAERADFAAGAAPPRLRAPEADVLAAAFLAMEGSLNQPAAAV